MRDTSDMMEDALSEDTMMDCGGDGGGLEDLVDLATDITDSFTPPIIREAAERLLILLGVDDDIEDSVSSSEDEGVEFDDEDEEPENARLLHQLAASLAQELKYSQQKQSPCVTKNVQGRGVFDNRDPIQSTSFFDQNCPQSLITQKSTIGHHRQDIFSQDIHQNTFGHSKSFGYFHQDHQDPHPFDLKPTSLETSGIMCLDQRLRMDDLEDEQMARSITQQDQVPGSWCAGWDACANEALRYLVEEEGLPPHHPTVLAMKNHLDLQKKRVFAQYAA